MKYVSPHCGESAKSLARRIRWTSKASLALRLALVACLGWASLASARSIQRWLNPASRVAPASNASLPPSLTPAHALLASAAAEGAWTIAGIPWQVQVDSASSEDAAIRWIDERHEAARETATGADAAAFAPLLRQLGAQRRPTAQGAAYQLDATGWKLRAQSRGQADAERFVSARFAMQSEGGDWRLFALSPSSAADGEAPAAGDLLPLGAEVRRLASRLGAGGAVQCQLLQVHRPAAALVAQWRQAGWKLRPTAAGGDSELQGWLCVGERYSVQAWCWPEAAGGVRNLLLVRL